MYKKRLLVIVLTLAMLMSLTTSVYAVSNEGKMDTDLPEVEEINRITDQVELSEIEKELGSEVPEGYRLIEVIESKTSIPFEDTKSLNIGFDLHHSNDLAWFARWEAKNIKKDSYDIYFPNTPINSSWYDGPMSQSITFTETVKAHFTAKTGISSKIVSAEIGFTAGYDITKSQEYSVSCASDERLNIKVFGNFAQWRYDAYKNGKYQGEEFAHKPIGLIFRQYRYAK